MFPALFPRDPQFWYETQRILGHATYGGSDTGEVLATAQRITAGNYDSWHNKWSATANRVALDAERSLAAGHLISARDGFLRASTYHRSAEFFLHRQGEDDPRVGRSYRRQVECFRQAAALMDPAVAPVSIPYDDVTLSGYLYQGAGPGPRPTIVMHNGFDGSCEEMHFFGAAAAAERGYNVLSFDGPGQPAARHRHGLVFRPDWEHVVSQVLDWLLEQPGIDGDRVALLGVSMGGYLAARAAAFEDRIAGLITIDGLFDLGATAVAALHAPRHLAEILLRAEHAPAIDDEIERVMATDTTARWALTHGQWAMGASSPRTFLASYLDYTLAGGIAERIACPTAVCEAEEDGFFDGQPRQLYNHLTCPKQFFLFTADDGAGTHRHSGAQRLAFARVYDWLDETLRHSLPLPGADARTGAGAAVRTGRASERPRLAA